MCAQTSPFLRDSSLRWCLLARSDLVIDLTSTILGQYKFSLAFAVVPTSTSKQPTHARALGLLCLVLVNALYPTGWREAYCLVR